MWRSRLKRRTTKFDAKSCFPFSQDDAAPQPAGRIGGVSLSGTGGKALTGMLAASASAMALTGMLMAASAPVKNAPPRAAKEARSSDLSARLKSGDRNFSHPVSLRIAAASPPSQSLCRRSAPYRQIASDKASRVRRLRPRAKPGLARFRRDGVNLHVGQSRVPEAERLCGGSRNIDDAPTDERPPIHDSEDYGAAIIEIEDFDPRSHRQATMRCGQSSCAIIGGHPELRRRCAEAHAESNRAIDKGPSQRRRSCASCSLGVRRNINTKLTNLLARCRAGLRIVDSGLRRQGLPDWSGAEVAIRMGPAVWPRLEGPPLAGALRGAFCEGFEEAPTASAQFRAAQSASGLNRRARAFLTALERPLFALFPPFAQRPQSAFSDSRRLERRQRLRRPSTKMSARRSAVFRQSGVS